MDRLQCCHISMTVAARSQNNVSTRSAEPACRSQAPDSQRSFHRAAFCSNVCCVTRWGRCPAGACAASRQARSIPPSGPSTSAQNPYYLLVFASNQQPRRVCFSRYPERMMPAVLPGCAHGCGPSIAKDKQRALHSLCCSSRQA